MTPSPPIDDPPSMEKAVVATPSPDNVVQCNPEASALPHHSTAPTTTEPTIATTTTKPTTIPIAEQLPPVAIIDPTQGQQVQQEQQWQQKQQQTQQDLEQVADAVAPVAAPHSSPTNNNTIHTPHSPASAAILEQLKGSNNASQQQEPYMSFEAFFSIPSSPEERGMSFEEMLMANEAVISAANAATAGDTYRSPTQDILLRPTSPFRRPFAVHSTPSSSPGSLSSRDATMGARSTPQTPIITSSTGQTPSSSIGGAVAASSPATTVTTTTTSTNAPTVSPGVIPIAIPSPNHILRASQDHDRDDLHSSPSSDPSSIKTILSSAGYFPGISPEEMEEAALDYRLKGRSRASRGYSADFSTNNWTSAMGIGSGQGPTQPGSPRSKSPVRATRQEFLHGHGHGSSHPHSPSSDAVFASSQQELGDHPALGSHNNGSSTRHLPHAIQSGGGGSGGHDKAGEGRAPGGRDHLRQGGEGTSTSDSSTEELPLTEFLSKAPPPPTVPPKPSVYQLPEYPPVSYQKRPAAASTNIGRTSNESGTRGSSSFQGPRTLYAGFPNFRPPTSPPPTDGFTINFSNQTPKIPITSVSGDFTGFLDYDPALEEILESRGKNKRPKRPPSNTTSPAQPPKPPPKGVNHNGLGGSEESATTLGTATAATTAGTSAGGADVAGTQPESEDHENDVWVRRYKVFPGRNVFLLRGRIMTSRDFPAFMVAVMLILVPTGLFHGFVSPYLWKHLSPAAPLVQAYLFVVAFSTMLKTSWTDPGVIPRGLDSDPPLDPPLDFGDGTPSFYPPKGLPRVKEIQVGMYTVRLKYCDTCRIYRPPRCSHCRQCDNCVEDEDHHCIWLNNCIGRRNYKYFWIFVTTAALYAFLTASLCLTHLLLLYNEKKNDPGRSFGRDSMGRAPVSSIVMLFAFIMGCAVGALAGYHYWLATMNRTTHEQLGASVMKPHEVDNPFDRGSIPKNCAAVLCRPPTKSYVRRREYTLA